MSTENFETQSQEQQLDLRELISLCLNRWTWFVASIAICLLTAVIYIKKTQPV